ncbi:hypothetical protein AWB85_11650 [Mycobacteroides immunogenum]|uniref:Uncharacterized protein n=1 Tax=Mycobacteroides immunogenum TaxID=83262 RepID=A0A179V7A0_9MYCO|nr:hypothetical protein [Mycobacteroides immunogenum]OAT67779.1 hypothetical protein AWB85_11650 [Mycobacteroides immunogenum]
MRGWGFGVVLVFWVCLLSACTVVVPGAASGPEPDLGADALFMGEIPEYGQQWSATDKTRLAYTRALRRIDPCGFRDALNGIGQPGAIDFRFWECEIELKVPGHSDIRAQVGLTYSTVQRRFERLVYDMGDAKVYESSLSQCVYDVPLALDKLPGAPELTGDKQPLLQVVVHEFDDNGLGICTVGLPIATAIAKRMPHGIPVRTALSAYPSKLAERDPCEILKEYPGKVRNLGQDKDADSANGNFPFECAFSLETPDDADMEYSVGIDVSHLGLLELEGYSKVRREGIDYYYNEVPQQFVGCKAAVLLGDPLYKRDSVGNLIEDARDAKHRASVTVMARAAGSGVGYGGTTTSCGKLRDLADKSGLIFRDSAR